MQNEYPGGGLACFQSLAQMDRHGRSIIGDQNEVIEATPLQNFRIRCPVGRRNRIPDPPDSHFWDLLVKGLAEDRIDVFIQKKTNATHVAATFTEDCSAARERRRAITGGTFCS